jgi:hypothetical protein
MKDKGQLIDLISKIYLEAFNLILKDRGLNEISGGSCVHLIAPRIGEMVIQEEKFKYNNISLFTLEMACAFAGFVGELRAREVIRPKTCEGSDEVREKLDLVFNNQIPHWRIRDMAFLIAYDVAGILRN